MKKHQAYFQNKVRNDGPSALVRIDDLKYTGKGRLKAGNSLCTEKAKGIMIYDKPKGNVRDIREGEFEIENPKTFLSLLDERGRFIKMKSTSTPNEKYMLYKAPDELGVKIVDDTAYTFDQTVIPEPPLKILPVDLIGYPCQPPTSKRRIYDVVVFFKDIGFMAGTGKSQNGYVIPSDIKLCIAEYEGKEIIGFVEQEAQRRVLLIKEKTRETRRSKKTNEEYTRLLFEGKEYFLKTTEAEKYRKNLLDWNSSFNIFDKATSKNWLKDAINAIEEFFDKEKDTDGDFVYEKNPNWLKDTCPYETLKAKEIKRSIVSSHPLESDASLYIENDEIKGEALRAFGISNKDEQKTHFKNYVQAIDIWDGLKGKSIPGLDLTKNCFWFAHPVYFINHLDKIGLLEGSVIPVDSEYKMQEGDWSKKNLPNTTGLSNLVKDKGCAIILLANAAYSLGVPAERPLPLAIIDNTGDFDDKGNIENWDTAASKLGLSAKRVQSQLDMIEYKKLNEEAALCCIGIQASYSGISDELHWVGVAGTTTYEGKNCFIVSPTSTSDIKKGNVRFTKKAQWIMSSENPVQVYVPESIVTGYVIFNLQ